MLMFIYMNNRMIRRPGARLVRCRDGDSGHDRRRGVVDRGLGSRRGMNEGSPVPADRPDLACEEPMRDQLLPFRPKSSEKRRYRFDSVAKGAVVPRAESRSQLGLFRLW